MIHLIPAWYHLNTWNEHEQFWYKVKEHTEFDDTVKQLQMFHRNEIEPYEIILLGHAPNFRHFLHRQGVLHASYWSCFDSIQQIKRREASTFSFHDLSWPEGAEFEYTPFVIVVYLKGIRYAQIEFGADGNMILIWIYKDGNLDRCNIYDDRGFISKTVVYENGICLYQDYLMEDGTRKFRLFVDGHVEINERCPIYGICSGSEEKEYTFRKLIYSNLGEVVSEVFKQYAANQSGFDSYCVAAHPNHNEIIHEVLSRKQLILSFFGSRMEGTINESTERLIKKSRYIVTDIKNTTVLLKPIAEKYHVPIKEISPYDSRPDFGISQQLSKLQILVPVDDLGNDDLKEIVPQLDRYLTKNENASVNFFTRLAGFNQKKEILNKVSDIIPQTLNMSRFDVAQCIDEPSVTSCVKKQRLVVNLSKTPDLFLQISALSAGIPQVVRVRTQYVKHRRNGMVIRRSSELYETLEFYLDGLANWNNAMISSYELGREYSAEVLINNWREVIDSVRYRKSASAKPR